MGGVVESSYCLLRVNSFYLQNINTYFYTLLFQTDDTAMLWGVKFYNDFLSTAGPLGNVQSELLFRKDASTFTFEKGWAFPRRIYFNGDNCVMPPPDSYPFCQIPVPKRLLFAYSIVDLVVVFNLLLCTRLRIFTPEWLQILLLQKNYYVYFQHQNLQQAD